jgi:hypothetical protein
MIKSEPALEQKQNRRSLYLEQMRGKSLSIKVDEVEKLFEQSYGLIRDLYKKNMPSTVKVDDNGIKILEEISKNYDNSSSSLYKGYVEAAFSFFDKDVPEWIKSPGNFRKSKKVELARKLYEAVSSTRMNCSQIEELCCLFFDVEINNKGIKAIRYWFTKKSRWESLTCYLDKERVDLFQFLFLMTLDCFNLLTIPIYYSLLDNSFSLIKKDGSFIVTELKLSRDFSINNLLMNKLNDKKLDSKEEIKKMISTALRKKYLHLSKNRVNFSGAVEGRFPTLLLNKSDIENGLRFLNLDEINETLKKLPNNDKEFWIEIVNEMITK